MRGPRDASLLAAAGNIGVFRCRKFLGQLAQITTHRFRNESDHLRIMSGYRSVQDTGEIHDFCQPRDDPVPLIGVKTVTNRREIGD